MGVGIMGYKSSSPRRAWLPSGPLIDSNGNRISSSSSSYSSPAKSLGNPDPSDYKIVKVHEQNGFTIMLINYPNCTNYEGNKILVFEAKLIDIINQKMIDPHFFDSNKQISPIARFVPSDKGWQMALSFVRTLR